MLLKIEHLSVKVKGNEQAKPILRDVSLEIPAESIVALVGGSGSGKTTIALAITRLLSPALEISQGKIIFQQKDILAYPLARLQKLRGKDIGMVFQEPLYAFNPVYRIGFQVEEVLKYHTPLNQRERREKILELFNKTGLTDPLRITRSYSHQLSAGMRQRAMIAQAVALGPRLIIADEPTSNLDVTIQAKIMDLFRQLKEELKLSILLITHDLGMVSHLADQVAVMKEGSVVEKGITRDILQNPRHMYTRQLMEASI